MAKCTDLKNQCWHVVKICPEESIFCFFAQNQLKIAQNKNLPNFFKNLPTPPSKIIAQSPSPACFSGDTYIEMRETGVSYFVQTRIFFRPSEPTVTCEQKNTFIK